MEFLEAVEHHGVLLTHDHTEAQVIVGVCSTDRAIGQLAGEHATRLISEAHSRLDDDILLS